MKKHRVGIVGSGFGAIVHAPAFSAHEAFDLVAIASPNNAERVARERKIPHAFPSVQAMLDGVELDVVSIASPPLDHHAAALFAFARGKHVLCEKPLALTVEQGEEILAAARRAGTVTGIAFEYRFAAPRLAAKELIENGHLGLLREIEVTFLGNALRRDEEQRHRGWWFEHACGGGVIQAIGTHMIDTAIWLAGRAPLAWHGFSRTANPLRRDPGGEFSNDVADGMFALLDFGDGLAGRIAVDWTTVLQSTTVAVHGELRTAVAAGKTFAGGTLFTVDAEETAELELAKSPYDRFAAAHRNLPLFMQLLDQFAAALEGKPNGLPTLEDGLLVQRIIHALGY